VDILSFRVFLNFNTVKNNLKFFQKTYGVKLTFTPAAMTTLAAHFEDTGRDPDYYDFIASGDLGKLGGDILRDLMAEKGVQLGQRYQDCGAMIFSKTQRAYQGGSGCGCSAVTLNTYITEKLLSGEFKRVLFLATGALLSTVSTQQGESVPGVAHAVVLEANP
jgi:stage V sporulation protein AD